MASWKAAIILLADILYVTCLFSPEAGLEFHDGTLSRSFQLLLWALRRPFHSRMSCLPIEENVIVYF